MNLCGSFEQLQLQLLLVIADWRTLESETMMMEVARVRVIFDDVRAAERARATSSHVITAITIIGQAPARRMKLRRISSLNSIGFGLTARTRRCAR